ncbi:OB-fold putative lipoprotein [Sabulilitoribacter multivorans]|uniref:OB-fold putative lipoprotein n=1 Tax=Flaviramulus multivorans TaxID=1304750 RepID=A0ABS9ILB5_9FLAO|nr:OB-fold putative lipoprotein [Flaviramulus multivorans]MCF7561382.1 OB-fold putative lipoprotein [Flaviramulus multivorans]
MKRLIVLIIIIITAICLYKYVYQNHRNIANETSSFQLTSNTLINEFSINPIDSETKYLNKTIEVTGSITNLNPTNLTLNNIIFCQFQENLQKSLSHNSQIKIKGRFIGYDDLLEQIKLDQCTVID